MKTTLFFAEINTHEDYGAFKLFVTDVGLLGAMGDIDARTLIEGNVIFEEFKGALTEQFVLQQLSTIPDLVIYYWSAERSTAEIDFLVQYSARSIRLKWLSGPPCRISGKKIG